MGFRFRRQIKIFPGVRLNVSKNHFFSSITVGGTKDLLKMNLPVDRKGPAKLTVGNFGGLLTGLSFEHNFKRSAQRGVSSPDFSDLRNQLEADHKARMEALERDHERRRNKGCDS